MEIWTSGVDHSLLNHGLDVPGARDRAALHEHGGDRFTNLRRPVLEFSNCRKFRIISAPVQNNPKFTHSPKKPLQYWSGSIVDVPVMVDQNVQYPAGTWVLHVSTCTKHST